MAQRIGAILTLRDNFTVQMRNATNRLRSFRNESRNTESAVGSLTKKLTGVAAGFIGIKTASNVFEKALNSASSFEGYRNTLNVVMKDTKKAAEMMSWATDFANKTPFETDSVVEATVRLQSYGIEAKKVMSAIGDMAGVMNKDIMQAVEAVADAQTGELERLKEFGITKQMIIDHANKIMKRKQIVNNKGQITDQKNFNKALFSLMNERFKGGMEIQANSFKGLMSTVKGVFGTALAEMMGISKEGEIVTGSAFDMIKQKVKSVADTMQKWSEDGTIKKISSKITEGMETASKFIQKARIRFNEIGSVIGEIADTYLPNLDGEFTTFKQILGSTFNEGLNLVQSGLEWIRDNSTLIQTAIVGLTTAYITQKGILAGVALAQNSLNVAVGISRTYHLLNRAAIIASTTATLTGSSAIGVITAAQWLWNTAMAANPIGTVVTAVALLTAGIYALYKNFDKVTGAIKKAWDWLTKWNDTDSKDKSVNISNNKSSMANRDDKSSIEKSNWRNHDRTTKQNALGTSYYTHGTVDEKGGEIKVLPNGTKVIPHDVSVKTMQNSKAKPNIIININGVNKSTEEIMNDLMPKLKLALLNSN
ncbi:hypothetical protein FQB35_04590 [Crassaminicella thermophila]|uniref:Tape measure domain-containing protein n=1 Tax=Crassaminicella thermophila TaxID=2599308 RepID=A0A5C0SEM1_CRATE|nr:hypothetical protein [Crassaminicella thermophila]QEK11698.1 hypothetical protein FQB35_04590 [Crassaminicella thermophila]